MKFLTRDILVTLSVKLILLTALWWVCVKDVEKPPKNQGAVWMLGSDALQISSNNKVYTPRN